MPVFANQVSKQYGRKTTALADLSFGLQTGRLLVSGPPGSGKSTLLALLAGSERATSGSLLIDGHAPSASGSAYAEQVAVLPAGSALPPSLSLREALDFLVLARRSLPPKAREPLIERAVERFRLTGHLSLRVGTLPPPAQRIAALAATCMFDPKLLLADEPTRGLTSSGAAEVLDALMAGCSAITTILATDDFTAVRSKDWQLLVLAAGRRRYFGPAADLVARIQGRCWEIRLPGREEPAHPYGFVLSRRESTPEGGIVLRGVCDTPPFAEAVSSPPTLEDAYRWAIEAGEALEAPEPVEAGVPIEAGNG